MIQSRTEFATDLEFEIATSRVHWSELESTSIVQQAGHGGAGMEADGSSGEEDDAAHETNAEIVESLRRQWPKSSTFSYDNGDCLEVGAKTAEGAHAEIFDAKHILHVGSDLVLKVFKEGSSLRDLQRQWPSEMLNEIEGNGMYAPLYSAWIRDGTVVMNGRCAFLMHKYWGYLRSSLI